MRRSNFARHSELPADLLGLDSTERRILPLGQLVVAKKKWFMRSVKNFDGRVQNIKEDSNGPKTAAAISVRSSRGTRSPKSEERKHEGVQQVSNSKRCDRQGS